MSLELTEEQRQAVRQSEGPPSVIDPETGTAYVLVRADVFSRLRAVVDAITGQETTDDSAYTAAETLDRVMAEDDANDPYLAELQKKYGGNIDAASTGILRRVGQVRRGPQA